MGLQIPIPNTISSGGKTHMKRPMLYAALFAALPMAGSTALAEKPVKFTVRVENITSGEVLKSSTGATAPLAFAPGIWLVQTIDAPLFTSGTPDRGLGLESLAEDGDPSQQAKYCEKHTGVVSVGVFNTPIGATKPGPITPGAAFEFSFTALPGQKLTIAQMWGQSNDLFYAPNEGGIALFDEKGMPIKGDITSRFILWDAGTEVNEEPGFGPNQGPRQSGPNTGIDERGVVTPVLDGYAYPRTTDVVRYTITPDASSLGSR
jgi:hypothetical protein